MCSVTSLEFLCPLSLSIRLPALLPSIFLLILIAQILFCFLTPLFFPLFVLFPTSSFSFEIPQYRSLFLFLTSPLGIPGGLFWFLVHRPLPCLQRRELLVLFFRLHKMVFPTIGLFPGICGSSGCKPQYPFSFFSMFIYSFCVCPMLNESFACSLCNYEFFLSLIIFGLLFIYL